jgi:hypothetical protein
MIYDLSYRAANRPDQATITLPWVASEWLSKQAIIDDFYQRFPGSRVVSLEPAEVAA